MNEICGAEEEAIDLMGKWGAALWYDVRMVEWLHGCMVAWLNDGALFGGPAKDLDLSVEALVVVAGDEGREPRTESREQRAESRVQRAEDVCFPYSWWFCV